MKCPRCNKEFTELHIIPLHLQNIFEHEALCHSCDASVRIENLQLLEKIRGWITCPICEKLTQDWKVVRYWEQDAIPFEKVCVDCYNKKIEELDNYEFDDSFE